MGCVDTRSETRYSTSRASAFTWGGTDAWGRVVMVAGHAALGLLAFHSGDAALRSVLIVLLSSLVLAAEAPSVPAGYDLFALLVGQFRAYVAGLVERCATTATTALA